MDIVTVTIWQIDNILREMTGSVVIAAGSNATISNYHFWVNFWITNCFTSEWKSSLSCITHLVFVSLNDVMLLRPRSLILSHFACNLLWHHSFIFYPFAIITSSFPALEINSPFPFLSKLKPLSYSFHS